MNSYHLLENQMNNVLLAENAADICQWLQAIETAEKATTSNVANPALSLASSLNPEPANQDLNTADGSTSSESLLRKPSDQTALSRASFSSSGNQPSTWANEIVEPAFDLTNSSFVYLRACHLDKIPPYSYVFEVLTLSKIQLNYLALTAPTVKALCVALVKNATVKEVDLANNDIRQEGSDYIVQLLRINKNIEIVNLAYNNLLPQSLEKLAGYLAQTAVLKSLSVAGNKIGSGIHYCNIFIEALRKNTSLKSLDLSACELGEEVGFFLGEMLKGNESITQLNVSWNFIRWRGAVAFMNGITANGSLQLLDFSWNGIGEEVLEQLNSVLGKDSPLAQLNLTATRFSYDGVLHLVDVLRDNTSLQILKIGQNPISSLGALRILEMYRDHATSGLTQLELVGIEVSNEFEELLQQLKSEGRTLKVVRGREIKEKDLRDRGKRGKTQLGDPLTLLFDHVKSSGLRLWDLFSQLDKDKSLSISKQEFSKGLKEARLNLTELQVDRIMEGLDSDRNGVITFEELLLGQKRYRERQRQKYEILLPSILNRELAAGRRQFQNVQQQAFSRSIKKPAREDADYESAPEELSDEAPVLRFNNPELQAMFENLEDVDTVELS